MKITGGHHPIADGESAAEGISFVDDRLPKCMMTRWPF